MLYGSPTLCAYIDMEYGSLDALYLEILSDLFRHAFDSSVLDNFYDAGNCIDGRLTSVWNWCSSLEKKRYFHMFLFTGASAFLLFAVFPCSLSWWDLMDSMASGRFCGSMGL